MEKEIEKKKQEKIFLYETGNKKLQCKVYIGKNKDPRTEKFTY